MKSTTPGFIGERLREARLARGMTGVALAKQLGVSRAAISQFEKGATTPRPELLWQIASVLEVPASYFMRRVERGHPFVFWRSNTSTTKAARSRAEIRLHWLADVVGQLQQTVRFPEANIPTIDLPSTPDLYEQETIELAAETARRYWGLAGGPISNVVWLLENNGVIITLGTYEEPNMDSFSRYDPSDRFPLICLNKDKASAVRSRFDAAHELGHLILHRRVERDYWSTTARIKQREDQAHKFAGAFLLPRESFADDVFVPSLDSFLGIKSKWKVSIQAMLMRCDVLNLLFEDQMKRLWRNLARRQWKVKEPLDDEIQHELPRLLPKAVSLLAGVNPLATIDLVTQVGMSSTDVAQLAMVSVDMFENPGASKVVQLHPNAVQ